MVLGIATLLVVGIGRILTSGSDGSSGPDRAAQVAAQPDPAPSTGKPGKAQSGQEKKRKKNKKKQTETVPPTPILAQPTGPCANDDIVATPALAEAAGGGRVLISVELRTQVSEACTWTVSPDTLTLKITSGDDDIWASRQCPESVPTRNLIVRQDVATKVGIRWSGRRSDETCSALTGWALPGWYHVVAAAVAGEPTDVQFELVTPPAPTVTRTITPSPDPDDKKKKNREG
jgi:hypothetical protein